MYHRDDVMITQTEWPGDHDLNCNGPDTSRTVHRNNPSESFWVCKNHWMTSVGDTSGYSIAWFSPDGNGDGQADVFNRNASRTVSWDVNVTDLSARQWWEVVVVGPNDPYLTTVDWMAQTAQIEPYHRNTIAVGKGPLGNDGNIFSGGQSRDPLGWQQVCGAWAIDAEGCASKAIRRMFAMTDNGNGTITFNFFGSTYTYAGQFPEQYRVYFKQHSYTPTKVDPGGCSGPCAGYTWHWDNIAIR